MKIKMITIKCLLCNSIDIYKYHVYIYNYKNELIYDDYTNENGIVYFKPTHYGIYKIKVISINNIIPNKIYTTLLISKSSCNKILLSFSKCINYYSTPIKINLTDKNYDGLPIKKGEIILWQKNI